MSIIAISLRVTGKVQGVGFRNGLFEQARQFELCGYVRNRADGSVEAQAVGPKERVQALILWCEKGTPAAQVASVLVERLEDVPIYTTFLRL
ncbi:MAG: acylphosphatase [Patescibacteria group bacterium]